MAGPVSWRELGLLPHHIPSPLRPWLQPILRPQPHAPILRFIIPKRPQRLELIPFDPRQVAHRKVIEIIPLPFFKDRQPGQRKIVPAMQAAIGKIIHRRRNLLHRPRREIRRPPLHPLHRDPRHLWRNRHHHQPPRHHQQQPIQNHAPPPGTAIRQRFDQWWSQSPHALRLIRQNPQSKHEGDLPRLRIRQGSVCTRPSKCRQEPTIRSPATPPRMNGEHPATNPNPKLVFLSNISQIHAISRYPLPTLFPKDSPRIRWHLVCALRNRHAPRLPHGCRQRLSPMRGGLRCARGALRLFQKMPGMFPTQRSTPRPVCWV